MSGHNIIKAQLICALNELFKLDKAVAVYAWIRRIAVFIRPDKAADDRAFEAVFKIQHIIGYLKPCANAARILDIVKRATGFFA